VNPYIWQHDLAGEAKRLRLMSNILDPTSIDHLARLPLSEDWVCLEIGAGNGSLSRWLAARIGPKAKVIATDIAPELMDGITGNNVEVRKLDVVQDGLPANAYDLIMLRALLHHLPQRREVVVAMTRALKPGGWIFIQEPDFYPTLIVEPDDQAQFWRDFLTWAAKHNIDYFVGRKIAPHLQELGIEKLASQGHTILYEGGSDFAEWWRLGIGEVAELMLREGATSKERLDHFFQLYNDPKYWTMTIAFTATTGQRPLG
jgi:SAM-dependent methyltransferase